MTERKSTAATRNRRTEVDYLILGAGPAGLQMGYFLERAGRDYLILDRGEGPGAFFETYPRHRTLISINKIHTGYDDPEVNLRWDWNSLLGDSPELLFKNYSREYFPSADVLVDYLRDYAEGHGLNIRYGTEITRIGRRGTRGRFQVAGTGGERFAAKRLIVATGLFTPYLPPIPGIELIENYVDVNVDPEDFANQKVLIMGKGNSGFETADNLVGTAAILHIASPTPVHMAWRTHFVGHLRAINNNLLDTYQLKSQNAVLDCTIDAIERRGDGFAVKVSYSHASDEQEELLYDRVIGCTGFRFDTSIFEDKLCPELTLKDRFPAQTSSWESTSVPDLFFAGALMQTCDYKKTTSAFIHGFRYNIRALHRMFEDRYHEGSWPRRAIDVTPEGLVETVIERVNLTSALWQQFGFLGDLIVVDPDGRSGEFYEELPVAFIHEGGIGEHENFYVVTLEFGKSGGDPFAIERKPVPEYAHESFFLHPVIRHFRGGEQISEHHILEDLHGEWKNEKLHIEPLLAYFRLEKEATARVAAASV